MKKKKKVFLLIFLLGPFPSPDASPSQTPLCQSYSETRLTSFYTQATWPEQEETKLQPPLSLHLKTLLQLSLNDSYQDQ